MPKFVLSILFGFVLVLPIACIPPQEPPIPPERGVKKELRQPRPGSTGVEPVLVRPGTTGVEPARFGGRPLVDPRGGLVRPGSTSVEPRVFPRER